MTDHPAVLICGPAITNPTALNEFNALADDIAARLSDHDVARALINGSGPSIVDGLNELKATGARQIVCLPAMLLATEAMKTALPEAINQFKSENPDIEVSTAGELTVDAKLLAQASARISAALGDAEGETAPENTVLVVAGEGSDDADANSGVAKMARMLWEGMGFGWTEVSYADRTHPGVDESLVQAVKLGYQRIVVFPYVMFAGDALEKVYAAADGASGPADIQIIKADHLSDTRRLSDSLIDHLTEALAGSSNMNCQICSYREQVIGDGDAHDHNHSHDHSHDHHDSHD